MGVRAVVRVMLSRVVIGISCAIALASRALSAPAPEELAKLLRATGFQLDAVGTVTATEIGFRPISNVPAWRCSILRGSLRWSATSDAAGAVVMSLCSGPPLSRTGVAAPLHSAGEAVLEADAWFALLGFPIARSEVREVTQPREIAGSPWVIFRAMKLGADTQMGTGGRLELDATTGALRSYARDPDLRLPTPLPGPKTGREEAVRTAVQSLGTEPWAYRPDGEPLLLNARRVFTYLPDRDDATTAVVCWWMVELGGHARLDHGPGAPAGNPEPVFWRVAVEDGAHRCFTAECRNVSSRWIDGKDVHW